MDANWVMAICGGLTVVGQIVNVALNWRLRAMILEMKAEIIRDVAQDYERQDVCEAKMSAALRRALQAEPGGTEAA